MRPFFALAVVLAGCMSTLPTDPSRMSAEQINALAKDRNANLACTTYKGIYGTGVVNYAILDKGIVINGTVVVDPDCKLTIINTMPQEPASVPR